MSAHTDSTTFAHRTVTVTFEGLDLTGTAGCAVLTVFCATSPESRGTVVNAAHAEAQKRGYRSRLMQAVRHADGWDVALTRSLQSVAPWMLGIESLARRTRA